MITPFEMAERNVTSVILALIVAFKSSVNVACMEGNRTLWVVSIVPWRRTPWVVEVLGRGTDVVRGGD